MATQKRTSRESKEVQITITAKGYFHNYIVRAKNSDKN